MGSLSVADIIIDKLLNFKANMKEGFKSDTALCLMSNSNLRQESSEMFDLIESSMFSFDCNPAGHFQRSKIESPLDKIVNHSYLGNNKPSLSSNLSSFSPHLTYCIENCIRYLTNQSEIMLPPLLDLNISDILLNSHQCSQPVTKNLDMKLDSEINVAAHSDIKMTIPAKITPPKEKSKIIEKCNEVNGMLNEELANRKTKELQKRSKKRRRRQKKNSDAFKPASASEKQENRKVSSGNSSRECDFKGKQEVGGFLVSVEHNIHVSPNIVSSFVISVGSISDDDDSDWDHNETDVFNQTEEFDFGLLVTNLGVPNICSYTSLYPKCESNAFHHNDSTDESAEFEAVLLQVNKNWNEINKDIELHPKLPSKVSFAADDKLVEVLPVEIYDRKGEWEMYATERLRFRRRIDEVEKIISPCLTTEHRSKVLKKLTENSL